MNRLLILFVAVVLCPVTLGAQAVRGTLLGNVTDQAGLAMPDAFNIPHFNNPNGTLGNANFGQITSVPDFSERLLRFGLRIMF